MQGIHGSTPPVVQSPFMVKSTMVKKYGSDNEKKNGKHGQI